MFTDYSADSEVTYFDLSFFIKEYIIKFNISVEDWPAMAMCYSVNNLLEDPSSLIFIEPPSFFNKLQQISATCIFHNHEQVFGRLKHF